MPPLTKSLQKRIQELKSSIESQMTELAAYEKVLEIESRQTEATETIATPAREVEPAPAPITETETTPEFKGSKIGMVATILKARGASGATPKEVDEIFSAQGIARSKNLIYNALSFLLKQRKLKKNAGRYFFISADSTQEPASPKKQRISDEGLRRIRAANKKRWAKERASQKPGATSAPKKSVRRAKKVTAKRATKAAA
jgi:hypothetical protein